MHASGDFLLPSLEEEEKDEKDEGKKEKMDPIAVEALLVFSTVRVNFICKPHLKSHDLRLHTGCVSICVFPNIFVSRTAYTQSLVIPGSFAPRALYCHQFPLSNAWHVSSMMSAALICCAFSLLHVLLFVMALCRCFLSFPVSAPSFHLFVT